MTTTKSLFMTMFGGALVAASLGACGLFDRTPPIAKGLSQPDAHIVWSYLQESDYRKNWPFWPGKGAFYEGTRPHGSVLMTYVNPTAHEALFGGFGKEMPAGSLIVKENYSPDRVLQATTVMYKAAEGYNPDHNNWFWLKHSAEGKITAAGKINSCQACHQQSENDYLMTPLP